MELEGIHHITAITGDARRNVEFYAGTLGLRLVKKSVNQDDPTIYHLFYADEKGSPGSDMTFFEYPGSPPGRPGNGMIHRIVWRVVSEAALDFWAERLEGAGLVTRKLEGALVFHDPEGLELELAISDADDPPLRAEHPDIPSEYSLIGFQGVRAYASNPVASAQFLGETLGFERNQSHQIWTSRGSERSATYLYDPAPEAPGLAGAGTVHHIAWATPMNEHESWRERVMAGGASVTPIIDRYYFKSIYFREPSGVLFEIATIGPGFTTDEPLESLGESLALPPDYESLRQKLERVLTPLPDPRAR